MCVKSYLRGVILAAGGIQKRRKRKPDAPHATDGFPGGPSPW